MLSDRAKTVGVSLLIHGSIVGALFTLAGRQILAPDDDTLVEMEILVEPPNEEPEPEIQPEPEPEIPTVPAPVTPPKRIAIKKVERPRPFQPEASSDESEREAPEEAEAIQLPTTPITFDMSETVGGGSGLEYNSTTAGTMELPPPGPRGGLPGDDYQLGARNIEVARDWQVTRQPVPINDHRFEPVYPPLAKRQGREAVIRIELDIDELGQVDDARVIDGPEGHGFRPAALAYVRMLRFQPAQSGERAVATRIEWTVYFYVRN